MMNIFFTVVFFSFLIWVFRNVLFWVALWQDKEYRLDRLSVHFRETLQGRKIFTSPVNIFKWLLLIAYIFIGLNDVWMLWYELVVGIFFILQAIVVCKDVLTHRIKRPVFTLKALIILFLSIVGLTLVTISPLVNPYAWLLFVDRLVPVMISLFVFFFFFPTEIQRDITIRKATKKMQEYKDVLVIAVSGSYGKTSTKEYIAQVLGRKYAVVKTPLSNNTPIGIANTILNKIHENTEIFVVEMGAYKKGEIEELTRIVKPIISVTTAISDQHISLYGSLANVVDSEYELIAALPKEGLSLFNGNSNLMDQLFEKTKGKKIYYKWYSHAVPKNAIIGASNVKPTLDGVSFDVTIKGETFHCFAPLLGIHVVENILPAIFLAKKQGMKIQEIIKAVSVLQPPPQTMVKRELQNGVVGIDDTFNASPESVFSAMEYLQLHKKKRICVLGPLTELGKNAKERHFQIGVKAAQCCDYFFLL
ncbi:MAG: UDP-N-acetylmuramoyl-tripeptide--D-alanyl-D-alanine ligase, partial [Patescibacteria group bacterium]|nr:UDP-N-acetylmuramoyl-tripeptide--D-alanyl-D-alanine ligase [Patescibacteria group bacterium]